MGVIATPWSRALAAVGSALVLAVLLSVWNHVSSGARADAFGTQAADRFNEVWHQPARRRSALAMLPPEQNISIMSKPSMVAPIATDSADAGPSPSLRSTRPATAPPTHRASSQANHAEPSASPNNTNIFSLPNVSDLAIPAAAIGVGALSLDLSLKGAAYAMNTGAPSFFTPAWSSSSLANSAAAPAPAGNPLTLPGPFHVILTTQPAGGASPADGVVGNGGGANPGGNGNSGMNGGGNGMGNMNGGGNGMGNGGGNAGGNGNGGGSGNGQGGGRR